MASPQHAQAPRELAGGARAHDPDAWERIYRASYPRLFAYARRRLPDDPAADDAVSETMARAIERIDGFRWRGTALDAWLFGILRRVVLEDHRRSTRRTAMEGPGPEPADPDGDPAAATESAESRRALRSAFGALSDSDRELLELRVVAGLSADQVAEVVGKRAGAVRMAQARALERLRERMEDGGRGR